MKIRLLMIDAEGSDITLSDAVNTLIADWLKDEATAPPQLKPRRVKSKPAAKESPEPPAN